jgi:hypothetical protein
MDKNVKHTVVFSAEPVQCHPHTHIPVYKLDDEGKKIDPPVIDHHNDNFVSGGEDYECFHPPVYANVHIETHGIDIKFELYAAVVKRVFDGRLYYLHGTNLANINHNMTRPSRQFLIDARAKWCKETGAKFNEGQIHWAFKDQHPMKLMNPSDRFISFRQDYIQMADAAELTLASGEKIDEACRKYLTEDIDALLKQLQFELPKEEATEAPAETKE